MKKFYAVKKGKNTGIFESWEECRNSILGFNGAVYKSFSTQEEALNYLNDEKLTIPSLKLDKHQAIVYVDGGYEEKLQKYGYGAVIFTKDYKYLLFGSSDDKYTLYRNVAGEVFSVLHAIDFLETINIYDITFYHDYIGLEKFATKKWKANNELSIYYQKEIEKKTKYLKLDFIHVKSHTNNVFNEEVDGVVKKSYDYDKPTISKYKVEL